MLHLLRLDMYGSRIQAIISIVHRIAGNQITKFMSDKILFYRFAFHLPFTVVRL